MLAAKPFQHFHTADQRHLQIQKHQVRKRMPDSIRECAITPQILDDLLSVSDDFSAGVNIVLFEGVLKQRYVVRIVLRYQHNQFFVHSRIAATQNPAAAIVRIKAYSNSPAGIRSENPLLAPPVTVPFCEILRYNPISASP